MKRPRKIDEIEKKKPITKKNAKEAGLRLERFKVWRGVKDESTIFSVLSSGGNSNTIMSTYEAATKALTTIRGGRVGWNNYRFEGKRQKIKRIAVQIPRQDVAMGKSYIVANAVLNYSRLKNWHDHAKQCDLKIDSGID